MQSAIISDTSCLILLDNIGELEILHKLFGRIITTNEVVNEFGNLLPNWVDILEPLNKAYQAEIESVLDKGEASAIALAVELSDSLLIIDDLKGRKFANRLGLTITGTIGILVDAKLSGHIASIKPILEKIKQTNFRLSQGFEVAVLKSVGEL